MNTDTLCSCHVRVCLTEREVANCAFRTRIGRNKQTVPRGSCGEFLFFSFLFRPRGDSAHTLTVFLGADDDDDATTTMTTSEERVLALFERLVEAKEKEASTGWWAAHGLVFLGLVASVATLVFNARHQIDAYWRPAAPAEAAKERAKAEEKARRRAKAELDKEEEQQQQGPPRGSSRRASRGARSRRYPRRT